jgi:hypothetical protein
MSDTTPQNARTREQQKSATERGEDLVYIINHAAACTGLDVANTPIEMLTQRYLNKKISVSHCAGCAVGKHDKGIFSADHESMAKQAGRWVAAEVFSDWAGAIPTVLMQRHAPAVMEGIGNLLTYATGDYFYAGATKDAKNWGWKHGFDEDSQEVKGRTKELYQHEMKHIAQAFVWTGFSTAICLGALKAMGDNTPILVNLSSKVVGVSSSFLGVLGTRAFCPENARKWDGWASEHIATPLTKIVSTSLGIQGTVVDDVLKQQDDFNKGTHWMAKN